MKLTTSQQHLGGADGIRAFACLAVMFHHFAQRLSMGQQQEAVQEIQAFLLVGNTGVSIFFVLSGFLLAFPFWRNYLAGSSLPAIGQYMFRRAARIMPGYYTVFFVCILLVLLLNIPTDYFLIRTITGLTFTSGFHYVTFFPSNINGPFWSISFEVFCYALMPVIMLGMFKWFKKRTFKTAFIYWIVSLFILIIINQLIHIFLTPDEANRGWQYGNIGGAKLWMPHYNPIGLFAHFTIGILASGVAARLRKTSATIDQYKRYGLFDVLGGLGLIGAFLLLWILRHQPEFSFSWQQQPFFYPYFSFLIAIPLAIGSHTLVFSKILDNGCFRFTAKVSFGLYLWHYLIIELVLKYAATDYYYMGVTSLERWALLSASVLIASYLIATLSYYIIEKPVLDWAHTKRFKAKQSISSTETMSE